MSRSAVDYEIVWDVVVRKIPEIERMIMELVKDYDDSDDTNRV